MDHIPLPLHKLCLILNLDLSQVSDAATLPARDHSLAAKRAAELTSLCSVEDIFARSVSIPGDISFASVQAVAFDPVTQNGSKPLSIDYIYSEDASQLGVRVTADLAVLDGVTAMRVAMHALELLEGHVAPSDASAFKKNPPFTYGWRHRLNFARMMAGVLSGIALARVFPGNKQGASANGALGSHVSAIVPNSCSSMLAYHAPTRVDGKAQSTGTFRTFRVDDSTKKPYKAFLKVLEQWSAKLKLRGYFVLMNMHHYKPGHVIGTEVKCVSQITDIEARHAGAFAYDHPPPPEVWPVNNIYHCERIFVNNYGRHTFAIKARPVAFKWDWVGVAAPVWGAGCTEVNGHFLAWFRGTSEGLDAITSETTSSLGDMLEEVQGVPKTMFGQ